jgi:uncharacterized protein YegJ (DUF2314 family)
MPRTRLLTLFLVAASVPASAQPVYATSRNGGVVNVTTADSAMTAAMAKGRATLGKFPAIASAPKRGQSGFAVKVGFPQPQGGNEFFWITPFPVRGDRFTGALGNRPVNATQLRAGQMVSFGRDEIVDRNYRKAGVVHGNFTGCAILATASCADREQFRRQVGLDCSR